MKILLSYKFWFAVELFSLIGLLGLFKHGNLLYIPWMLVAIIVSGVLSLLTFKFDKI